MRNFEGKTTEKAPKSEMRAKLLKHIRFLCFQNRFAANQMPFLAATGLGPTSDLIEHRMRWNEKRTKQRKVLVLMSDAMFLMKR